MYEDVTLAYQWAVHQTLLQSAGVQVSMISHRSGSIIP